MCRRRAACHRARPCHFGMAVHAGGTGELHAGGPPGWLPRKLNILGTAPYPRRVTAPSVRRRSGVIPEHWRKLVSLPRLWLDAPQKSGNTHCLAVFVEDDAEASLNLDPIPGAVHRRKT